MDRAEQDDIRQRIDSLIIDWGSEVSALFDELEAARAEIGALQEARDDFELQQQALKDRCDGQEELIDVLRAEADEAHDISRQAQDQDKDM